MTTLRIFPTHFSHAFYRKFVLSIVLPSFFIWLFLDRARSVAGHFGSPGSQAAVGWPPQDQSDSGGAHMEDVVLCNNWLQSSNEYKWPVNNAARQFTLHMQLLCNISIQRMQQRAQQTANSIQRRCVTGRNVCDRLHAWRVETLSWSLLVSHGDSRRRSSSHSRPCCDGSAVTFKRGTLGGKRCGFADQSGVIRGVLPLFSFYSLFIYFVLPFGLLFLDFRSYA